MKVLMFGWEFPPFNTGGLGTACHGLTRSLSQKADITFVMPRLPDINQKSHVKLIGANDLKKHKIHFEEVDTLLKGYLTSEEYHDIYQDVLSQGSGKASLYGRNLFLEVERLAKNAALIAKNSKFDIIHAHDWMTFKAGITAKKVSGKPLVVHVHATEFDRTGGNGVNQIVYDIEREGMHAADAVITVSNYTKQKVIDHYGVPEEKIHVVHNGVECSEDMPHYNSPIRDSDKIVLFLGRITIQKGPDYFVEAAKKVLNLNPNVKFVMAGSGDMTYRMIERAAELGISDKLLFTGFLRGDDIDRAYQMADLYVMPSVSEPFGITPLESLKNGTPVMISKQSGVSEVLNHCLKVDFWDIDEMANKILGVLQYSDLHNTLVCDGMKDVRSITWSKAADKCIDIYNKVIQND